MKRRGETWRVLANRLPFAGMPFGRCGALFSVQEVKDWREQEQKAGRSSGLEEFYRSHDLCWPCRSRGYKPQPVDMDEGLPLFEECESCGGTGAQINRTADTDIPSPS